MVRDILTYVEIKRSIVKFATNGSEDAKMDAGIREEIQKEVGDDINVLNDITVFDLRLGVRDIDMCMSMVDDECRSKDKAPWLIKVQGDTILFNDRDYSRKVCHKVMTFLEPSTMVYMYGSKIDEVIRMLVSNHHMDINRVSERMGLTVERICNLTLGDVRIPYEMRSEIPYEMANVKLINYCINGKSAVLNYHGTLVNIPLYKRQ